MTAPHIDYFRFPLLPRLSASVPDWWRLLRAKTALAKTFLMGLMVVKQYFKKSLIRIALPLDKTGEMGIIMKNRPLKDFDEGK